MLIFAAGCAAGALAALAVVIVPKPWPDDRRRPHKHGGREAAAWLR